MVKREELQQYLYGFLVAVAPASTFALLILFGFGRGSSKGNNSILLWPPFWISLLVAAASISGLITLKRKGTAFSRQTGIGLLVGVTCAVALFTYGGI